ncbi:hypothetical protein EBS80_00865 [bacterium]|nr:hypothetical protein [bacterium]
MRYLFLVLFAACGDLSVKVADQEGPDADGDGFSNCEQEMLGNDVVRCDDLDCDDTNPTVYPGAPQSCDGGLDHNCDGTPDWTVASSDCDGDGVRLGEGDCDDFDSTVSPASPEWCDDWIDNDCDGAIDGPACEVMP